MDESDSWSNLHPHWEVAPNPYGIEAHHKGGDELDHLTVYVAWTLLWMCGLVQMWYMVIQMLTIWAKVTGDQMSETWGKLKHFNFFGERLEFLRVCTCNTVRYFFHHRYGLGKICFFTIFNIPWQGIREVFRKTKWKFFRESSMKGGGASSSNKVFQFFFCLKTSRITPWLPKCVLHIVWALYYLKGGMGEYPPLPP